MKMDALMRHHIFYSPQATKSLKTNAELVTLMETSWADRKWAFLIHLYVYSNNLGRPESSSATTHTHPHTLTHPHTPRGACQYTLQSCSPWVKSFRDDPQKTLLRSTHMPLKAPGRKMDQDGFNAQLSAAASQWSM